jgi:hypothetical protein
MNSHTGIQTWVNPNGIRIFQLHYSADPAKGEGAKAWNERQNAWLSPWADKEERGMTSSSRYRQEYEVDFTAQLGQPIYQLDDDATLEQSFPIPNSWTRYSVLDPHPRVPHAMLWGAADPNGDVWIYREYWPSNAYAKPGNIPEDDRKINIQQYLEAVKFLESKDNSIPCANGEPENVSDEKIYRRVIDYAARAFGQGTTDDPEQPNFQQRFESIGRALDIYMRFEDAKKDRGVGFETVNEWLKPRAYDDGTNVRLRSKLHIFQDKCPELLYQIRNYRHRPLTALQAETQDPSPLPVKKRDHFCDCLRYLLMEKPEFVRETQAKSTWKPLSAGVAY